MDRVNQVKTNFPDFFKLQPNNSAAKQEVPAPVKTEEDDISLVICPFCKSQTWDNRAKKNSGEFNPKYPDYTCKNRELCGAVAWLKNGEPKWKK